MALKMILLVRHGQYQKEPEERLTKLGIKQAGLIGRRLKEVKIDKFMCSTMPRAVETATIIRKQIRYKTKPIQSNLYRECIPGFPKAKRQEHGHTNLKKLAKDKRQADRAYAKLFKFSNRDTNQLVVMGTLLDILFVKP